MLTTHPTATALLRKIVECPADDFPRLIYADVLEENGETARGEFIRIGVELAKPEPMKPDQPSALGMVLKAGLWSPWATASIDGYKQALAAYVAAVEHRAALRRREQELFHEHAGPGQVEWLGRALHNMLPCGIEIASFLPWFRRGFVASVRTTAALWCGGPCQRCNGDGRSTGPPESRRCPRCSGTRRVGGHGPAVVLAAPVESVILTDRRPHQYSPGNWHWISRAERDWTFSEAIPSELFALLHANTFSSPADAVAELSRVAVAWARRESRLPPLHA